MANRTGIYYWKCDRPDAFFAIRGQADSLQLDKGVHDMVSAFSERMCLSEKLADRGII